MATEAYLRVTAAGEHYALPVARVLEVVETGDVTPVAGAPATIAGVRNLRGQLVPVLDLAAVLGLPRSASPRCIAIAEDDLGRVGLAIDGVLDVNVLPAADSDVAIPGLDGAVLVDGTLVGVVDVPALVGTLDAEAGR